MHLSVNLQLLRKNKNITLKQLEAMCGISFSTIAKIERGERKQVTIQTVILLAKALEVSIDTLVLYDLSAENT